ncbi:MAG: bifunctional (p)ppGpp synthetase/guanosine-3',5'-bis(diphosphate) 3'-pyrophosphohydrolase [Oscillospiraceae bacterium]|nr:bifunctional (p)ppGpp synthetase/guanosine-3',5'-bis(diphosphate) 3'-pyrophosphohydrolase [Oscillospiraceae bacterium]MBR6208492.1 bifunctional (p)ppGpp synthetase/guanosine-3',5'-bis(diphosphate) 3'-pyrophosphohydrolase [Oscillospiraceae bacterium]
MAEEIVELEYRQLARTILEHNPGVDLGRIRAAFEVADLAHSGQRRKAGTPYVTHVVAAAQICAEMGLDEDSIVAALLHDTIEDTSLTYADIARQFGTEVADIVEGVTKLTRVQFTSREDEQMENLRKMLMAMAKDIRVILIKIADRLHNMRTMEYMAAHKQVEKSTETMEIYAPIAHRLGLQKYKWELEDLSLKYLDPEGYQEIMTYLDSKREELDRFMNSVETKITKRLEVQNIRGKVYGRIKHIYSIYRKMYNQKRSMDEIFDLCAFRVIVDSIADCYNVLGQIHDMFTPVPGRFKDYIATPKPNGYQSVHTTVIGEEGIMFEVQIRTWTMHRTAEYGIAAHWKYKSGEAGVRAGDEEKFAWVRRLLESQQDSDAGDFVHDLKMDMFNDEVFVFTPQGDVINLPAGACPIDFAYIIHSAVGNHMIGAKVNGRIVSFDYTLQNGDIVDILTSKSAPGPSRDWLNLCKSNAARSKIRQWLKKERREENILRGREMFDAEYHRAGLAPGFLNDDELVETCTQKLSVTSLDDLYAAIGYGGMTATRAVNRFKDEIARNAKLQNARNALDKLNDAAERRNEKPVKAVQGVLVEGIGNCLIKFSRCCTPVPGDPIVGFITRGNGVSIHRADCPNYLSSLQEEEKSGRWLRVSWADNTDGAYLTSLRILCTDRNGLILDIAGVLNALNSKVRSLNARSLPEGKAMVYVAIEVPDLEALKIIIGRIRAVRGVREIHRGNG